MVICPTPTVSDLMTLHGFAGYAVLAQVQFAGDEYPAMTLAVRCGPCCRATQELVSRGLDARRERGAPHAHVVHVLGLQFVQHAIPRLVEPFRRQDARIVVAHGPAHIAVHDAVDGGGWR